MNIKKERRVNKTYFLNHWRTKWGNLSRINFNKKVEVGLVRVRRDSQLRTLWVLTFLKMPLKEKLRQSRPTNLLSSSLIRLWRELWQSLKNKDLQLKILQLKRKAEVISWARLTKGLVEGNTLLNLIGLIDPHHRSLDLKISLSKNRRSPRLKVSRCRSVTHLLLGLNTKTSLRLNNL